MFSIKKIKKIKESEHYLHETKRSVLVKFLLVLIVFLLYFAFVSLKYGINNGFLVTLLTWSFFVFCTPIADAGLLLDFPVRLITGIRMIYSEIAVWIIAFFLNLYSLTFNSLIYNKTVILQLFRYILLHPIPFWSIIFVSAIGTFMSIYFGDELIDVARHEEREKYGKHKKKYHLVIFIFIVVLAILLYDFLLKELGINIPI